MPVIVLTSPKGGVGKSTCAILLATGLARMGADVTVIDADPNGAVSSWAEAGLPIGITVANGIDQDGIIAAIRAADGDGCVVIVDLEGVASVLVSRAILQADLVLVPMQASTFDAKMGLRAIHLVAELGTALGRTIPCAAVLTKTGTIKTRIQRELERELRAGGIDLIEPPITQRPAFTELFAYGHDLVSMAADRKFSTGGNIAAALLNATLFVDQVYDRIKATPPVAGHAAKARIAGHQPRR